MIIAVGTDHRGFKLKERIKKYLRNRRMKVIDFGAFSDDPVDYPEFALKVAQCVGRKRARFGVLLCHTGNGMAIAANKVKDVRAAVCPTPAYADLARRHNDANILVIPAGFVKSPIVMTIVRAFFKSKFEAGRHKRRIDIITRYEKTR
jgi:ribose 5-phosphate isomerase B